MAWNPPIGIPNPNFGVDAVRPSRPADWSSPVAGYYYINYSTGSDSGNTYGTPSSPRYSIPRPVPAGSYVEVHGVYSLGSQGSIWIEGYGTNDTWIANTQGPVWVVGETSSNRPVFKPTLTTIYGSYVYLEFLEFKEGGCISIGCPTQLNTDHIMLRNCLIQGQQLSTGRENGIGMEGYSIDATVNNCIVYNCYLNNFGDMEQLADQDAAHIIIGRWCNTIWVVDNIMETATGSFRSGGAYDWEQPEWTHHIYIGRNTMTNIQEVALWVKMGTDIIMSQNTVYMTANRADTYRRNGQAVPDDYGWDYSIGIGCQYKPNKLWIIFNRIFNVSYGIRLASNEPGDWAVYIIGNIIYNAKCPMGKTYGGSSTWSEAGIHVHGGDDTVYIVNNSIYNTETGINISGNGNGYHIHNNIISNTNSSGAHLHIDNTGNALVTNILFHQDVGNIRIWWGGSIYNVIEFIDQTTQGDGCIDSDPEFIHPRSGCFLIKSTSEAVGNGDENGVYDIFYSLYSIDIKKDFLNKNRPVSNWSIGALEYSDEMVIGSVYKNKERMNRYVSIYGNKFNSSGATVLFGSFSASLISQEDTKLEVKVPNLKKGLYNVNVTNSDLETSSIEFKRI